MHTPLLEVQHLHKSFVLHLIDGQVIDPVQHVSFRVDANQHFLIWGRSGIGKTSILKCIYRTYLVTSGSIRYNSAQFGVIDLASVPERTMLQLRESEIGYCSQFLKVLPRVSALDIISEPLRRKGMTREQAYDIAKQWLTDHQSGAGVYRVTAPVAPRRADSESRWQLQTDRRTTHPQRTCQQHCCAHRVT
jgi:alpha-D-ribose 1-methylphosphonate 5-triphosphate synthase subunit PhnL